jgi:hypothetical protein
MRRAFAVAAIGAIATVSVALLVPTGAGAAQTTDPPTPAGPVVEALCGRLPDLQTGVTVNLAQATTTLTSATDTLATRRAAMTTAMTDLADAVVEHLSALDGDGDPAVTGQTVRTRQSAYVGAVVNWSRARRQAFDSEQAMVVSQLQQTMLDSLDVTACR